MAQPGWDALFPFESTSVTETIRLGSNLAAFLESGDVIALYGGLGAGKTHFVKGISKALGVDEDLVTSPTFTLVNEYESDALSIFHFDAYRVEKPGEFQEIGFEEYLYGDGICLIEWPVNVESLLPENTIRITLTHTGADGRKVSAQK